MFSNNSNRYLIKEYVFCVAFLYGNAVWITFSEPRRRSLEPWNRVSDWMNVHRPTACSSPAAPTAAPRIHVYVPDLRMRSYRSCAWWWAWPWASATVWLRMPSIGHQKLLVFYFKTINYAETYLHFTHIIRKILEIEMLFNFFHLNFEVHFLEKSLSNLNFRNICYFPLQGQAVSFALKSATLFVSISEFGISFAHASVRGHLR